MKTKIKHLKLDRYIANVIILLVISTFTSSNLSCQVTRYIGNVDSNIPRVLKVLDDNIYIYSYNGNNRQGVIIKQDLNGNNIWQLDLADDFIVNDFAKLGTTLMLVGSDDLFNFNNKNSAYCKIEDLGLTASIVFMQYFNKTDRDNFTRIIPKPGSTTNFLIQHYFTSSGDNVAILEIDNSGSILTNVAYSTIDDDQFWTGLKSGQDGITLIGDFGNLFNACYTELDNNLNGDKAYIINGLRTFRDYIDRGPNRKILVGYNNVINGYIVETDSLGQVTWAKRIDQTRVISDIFFGGSIAVSGGFEDTYYMLGQEDYGGGYYRQVMIKFIYTNINGTITTNIDWAKYFDEGTQSVPGAYVDFVSNKFYYAGFQHINATSNFGQADIFEAIVNKNFESCFTTDLTYTLTDTTFTTSELTITNSTTTFPSPTSFSTGSSVSFMTLDTCVTGPCHVDSLFVGTGYDTNNDTTHPVLSQDGQWILKEEPQNNGPVTLDSPAFVINKASAWANPSYNSTYISAFNMAEGNAANINAALPPYRFQRCFCVEEDNTLLEFNIDVHVDNRMQLYFLDPQNPGSRFLLDEVPGSSTSNFKGAPEHLNITPYNVATSGTYCIEAELRNDHEGSPMGLNIGGWIKGASVIKDSCCSQTSYITGFKYNDDDCDGNVNMHDPPVEGYEIELYDENDVFISSFITDCNGYYRFEVQPGTYQVKEVLQSDWEYSVPASGEYLSVVVDTNVVVQLNFGNIYTGPIETDPIENTCFNPESEITFTWSGQECDCELQLQVRTCGSGEDWETIADIPNSGSYTWTIPDYYMGDYEFQIYDCDDYEIPFVGCINIDEYGLALSAVLKGCGEYDFFGDVTGVDPMNISSHLWTIDVLAELPNASPSYTFQDAGQYFITYEVVSDVGCVLEETILLDVEYGVGDPDCKFADTDVLSEVIGDLFINDECQGVIMVSPNGTCFRLTIGDDGSITSQAIECP